MKMLAKDLLVSVIFVTLALSAHADPTKDKNAGQEVAEKFIFFLLGGNFQEAARLVEDENDPNAPEDRTEALKVNFDKVSEIWQKRYSGDFAGAVLNSRTLAPQTLVSFRRGDDGKKFDVLVYFTEDHAVSMPGKAKPWHFYWHYEMVFEVTDGKITNVKDISAPENLIILKPENCVAPAVC